MQVKETHMARRGLKGYLSVAARGFAMGAADVVPGVSGGTMAFILGVYDELLHAIHAVDLDFMRRLLKLEFREAFADFPWRFLLALGLGIGAAIFTLAEGLNWALNNHPVLVWSFFFGFVLASVLAVSKRVRRWTQAVVGIAGLAALSSFLVMGMVPLETPVAPWFLFLSGALAITAMILPGLSGAFILVLLGKYHYILEAVVHGDLATLTLVAAGAAAGLLSFARLLRWMFHRHHDATVAALMGLILGALRKVWPWKASQPRAGSEVELLHEYNVLPPAFTSEVGLAIGLAALGFGLVLGLDYLAGCYAARNPQVEVLVKE